jgi:hypothetical protein
MPKLLKPRTVETGMGTVCCPLIESGDSRKPPWVTHGSPESFISKFFVPTLFPEPSVSMIEERERHQIVDRFASRLVPRGNAGGWCLS